MLAVTLGQWFARRYPPDWKPADFTGADLCLSDPAADAWCISLLDRLVREFKLDMLEHDGYLVTLTTDMTADASYCLVFDARRMGDGPVCKLLLPERVSSGTHSAWVAGSELRRWPGN